MNFKKTGILTLIMLLVTCNIVLGVSLVNYSNGEEKHANNINIVSRMDGSFKLLTYDISSTGANSGIRYRTTDINISVGSYTATINTMALVNFKPASGSTVYSQVIVTKEDVIKAIGESHRAEVMQMLTDPSKYINIGANIQIYNAGTGKVLANIKNQNDVAKVAEEFGFGDKHIDDMKSRFQKNNESITIVTEEEREEDPEDSGLRPPVFVK